MGTEFIFKVVIPSVIGILASVVGFFVGRRKAKAEAQKTEMENMGLAIEIWRKTTEKLQMDYEGLSKKYDALNEKYEMLEKKYEILNEKYGLLQQENHSLKKDKT